MSAKLNDLVRDIKYKNPHLSNEEAVKEAVSYMAPEDAEYRRLMENMPDNVKKLDKFKLEATELLSLFQNKKDL